MGDGGVGEGRGGQGATSRGYLKGLPLGKRSMLCSDSYVLLLSVRISLCMYVVWNWKSTFVLNFMCKIGSSVEGIHKKKAFSLPSPPLIILFRKLICRVESCCRLGK